MKKLEVIHFEMKIKTDINEKQNNILSLQFFLVKLKPNIYMYYETL